MCIHIFFMQILKHLGAFFFEYPLKISAYALFMPIDLPKIDSINGSMANPGSPLSNTLIRADFSMEGLLVLLFNTSNSQTGNTRNEKHSLLRSDMALVVHLPLLRKLLILWDVFYYYVITRVEKRL